jgi:hypothetical protein
VYSGLLKAHRRSKRGIGRQRSVSRRPGILNESATGHARMAASLRKRAAARDSATFTYLVSPRRGCEQTDLQPRIKAPRPRGTMSTIQRSPKRCTWRMTSRFSADGAPWPDPRRSCHGAGAQTQCRTAGQLTHVSHHPRRTASPAKPRRAAEAPCDEIRSAATAYSAMPRLCRKSSGSGAVKRPTRA